MNKKTSLPINKTVSQRNTKHNELTNEPQEQSNTDGKAKITPMSKDPLMGIF